LRVWIVHYAGWIGCTACSLIFPTSCKLLFVWFDFIRWFRTAFV
jgi:hypothetical protein